MGFETTLSSGIAIIDSLTRSMQVTVTHQAYSGPGNEGTGEWATGTTKTAILIRKRKRYRNASGEECVSEMQLIFPRSVDFAPNDKFTFNSMTAPCVEVSGVLNPTTGLPYATEVLLGATS